MSGVLKHNILRLLVSLLFVPRSTVLLFPDFLFESSAVICEDSFKAIKKGQMRL